jgi:putative Mg2+ transporter-C (MgtC) family protein
MNIIEAWWVLNQPTLLIVGVAAAVGLLIGLQNVFLSQWGSIRIHVMVATGAALFVHVPMRLAPGVAVGELVQGVATGIGFIGAGAILQQPANSRIKGISVAGTIWLTAALGMAVGLGWKLLPILIAIAAMVLIRLTPR